MRTFGVEEELLIVDPATGSPIALADALIPGLNPRHVPGHEDTSFSFELKLEQIETQTAPGLDYAGLLHEIRLGRSLADHAARQHGARVASLATSPLPASTPTTPNPPYVTM